MSIITRVEIQKKNDNRVNIYVDDKFFVGISLDLCIKNGLKSGLEIDKESFQAIILEDEKSSAFNKSVKYLSSSLRTIKQIREYLSKKEYNEVTIDYVVDKLIEYKYLDDESYVKSFVLTYSNKYGKLKLKAMLRQRGVADDIIDNYFEDNKRVGDIENVARKYLRNKDITKDTFLKLGRFLYSRGYEFEEINSIVNKLKEENSI